ncbi:MAG: YdcF family protein [Clostridiales bacterium]|nr:YdcF family protein [Clostridiales bacterium]
MKDKKIHPIVYCWLTGFAGAFICICYFYYWFISLITNSSFIVASVITFGVVALVAVPFLLRNYLKKWFGKGYRVLKWIYSAGMWLYVIAFSLFTVFIVSYDSSVQGVYAQYPQDEELVVITFGAKVHGLEPGVALRRRLDVTLELMNHYENAYVIVSGGQGADEENTEAAAMKKYLVDRGIAESRIYSEERATDTIENIRNSLAIMNEHDLSGRRLIGVSSNYHAARIDFLAKQFGLDMHLAGAQKFDFAGVVREFMAYVKLFVFNRNFV